MVTASTAVGDGEPAGRKERFSREVGKVARSRPVVGFARSSEKPVGEVLFISWLAAYELGLASISRTGLRVSSARQHDSMTALCAQTLRSTGLANRTDRGCS